MFFDVMEQVFYRPLLNLLFILHGVLPYGVSLGWSVVVLAATIRTLLIPLLGDLVATDSERRLVEAAIQKVETDYAEDPAMKKKMMRKLMRESSFSIIAWVISMGIQLIILLTLWRLFGSDIGRIDRLLYDFVALDAVPNVMWFQFALTEPSTALAGLMAILLFLDLTLGQLTSRLLSTSTDNKTLQYGLPIVGFLVLSRLPAVLSLYLISTLILSLTLLLLREISRRLGSIAELVSESERREEQEGKDEEGA